MGRRALICLAVIMGLFVLSSVNSHARGNSHWSWDFSTIESPDCGERLDFEPVKIVVQLKDGAKPDTFKAWLNGRRILKIEDNYQYNELKNQIILRLGPEDGLRVKDDRNKHWWGRNVIRTMVKGETWSGKWRKKRKSNKTDIDYSWFFVKAHPLLERETDYGKVMGTTTDQFAWAWKGIPFAKPPVGNLRWKAPVEPESWEGVRDASESCSECTQYFTTPQWIRQPYAIGSEDCLYLDIYRPRSYETDLPVYVWIHGGSNNFGTAKDYDGSALAQKANIVVVVLQYRLGPLGWLTHPALRAGENDLDDSGNFGTLDNVKALDWIQNNIDAFGGSPGNVTIAGESAGSHNVMNLVISPQAAGLFHKAISESGGMTTDSVEEGEASANALIDGLLVYDGTVADLAAAAVYRESMNSAEIEAYLRGKSNKDVYEVILAVYGSIGTYDAFRDGVVIPGRVRETIASGDYNKVPLILGSNEYETKAFMPLYGPAFGLPWFDLIDVLDGNQELDDVLPTPFDKELYEVSGYYGSRNWKAKYVDSRARTLKCQQDDVWAYLFKWGGPGSGPVPFDFIYGAGHAMEISFFFGGDTSMWGYGYTPENDTAGRVALQDAMMTYLANFTHTGDPNGSGLEPWEKWSNIDGEPKSIVFDSGLNNAQIMMTPEEVTIPGVYGELTARLATWDATFGDGTLEAFGGIPWLFQWSTEDPVTCPLLTCLEIEDVTIQSTEKVPEAGGLPAHCLVNGFIEEEIGFEVRLPDEWNGKFYMGGGGGFVGTIQSQGYEDALQRGYATAGTDSGHKGGNLDGSAFLNNWERVVNWAYQAIHLTTANAKKIIRTYYGEDILYSYFSGCSTGGRQAMMESQKYPEDFDGLIAGAPAYVGASGVPAWALSQSALYPDPSAPPIVPFSKVQLIDTAVLAMCDDLDGVVDGLLRDPRECNFDLETDLPMCADNFDPGDNTCFTIAEKEVLKLIYGYDSYPWAEPATTAYPFGGEIDPGNWDWWVIGGPYLAPYFNGYPNIQYAFAADYFKYLFFNDPDYDIHDFEPDNPDDLAKVKPAADMVNATETDLSAFKAAGGKMIMYNGWSDPCITPLGTIKYYEAVLDTMGGTSQVDDFFRLYMIPGVGHCGGGRGPGNSGVDFLTALEKWVENDVAPVRIVAEHDTGGTVDMSRPLCPYPQVEVWDGIGDINEEASFTCQDPI
jgi:para-nitrobenzyl esterase